MNVSRPIARTGARRRSSPATTARLAASLLALAASAAAPVRAAEPTTAASSALAATSAVGAFDHDVVEYGKKCAALIAEAPPFDCLDGEIVPITVDGKTPEKYTRHMSCDRPAYLPYSESTDGQCAPYTRVRTARDDDVQMILFCRRMFIRPPDDPHFDSIEIIMHNVVTGSTCFFISKNFGENPDGEDARRVPPPSEETPPGGFVSARELWATPQEIADHGCIFCHDSDPWMRTPWIAQTPQLPSDPWGFHSVDVGGPFAKWPKPMSIATRGNSCVGCHRIGSLNTCGTQRIPTFGEQPAKMLQSVGRAPHGRLGAAPGTSLVDPPESRSTWARTYPHSYWMPVGNDLSLEMWNLTYEQDVAELERCCADPSAPGCIVEPIEGKQAWLSRVMAAHERAGVGR